MTARPTQKIAIVGAGMAGVCCARTLAQAGHRVMLFESQDSVGGRMATQASAFGSFDSGAQYFTVRDARFAQTLATVPGVCKPWSANAVRVLDEHGRVALDASLGTERHWIPVPGMQALVAAWAEPLLHSGALQLQRKLVRIERDALQAHQWQLHTQGPEQAQQVYGGFDRVLLATAAEPARQLLGGTDAAYALVRAIAHVQVAPCWSLMLAFPQAMQPGLLALGPQWNAARSTHHRIAWLARESSKPGRSPVERWTVQASPQWSQEHLEDDPTRVQAKLLKAFAEVTGIHAQPSFVQTRRWRHAQTTQALGQPYLFDAASGLGACGDWCLGHRVEDAFVSALELALAVA